MLIYNTKSIYSQEGKLQLIILFDTGTLKIFNENDLQFYNKDYNPPKFCFENEIMKRIWKNTGKGKGIICQYDTEPSKILYLADNFLNDPKIDGKNPYVNLYIT